MKKRVIKQLQQSIKDTQEKLKEIENFDKNPLIFFDELQHNQMIIPELLNEIDEDLLMEYQSWQYPLILDALRKNFKLSPFDLGWNEEAFPSPIYILHEGYPVAMIEPYKKNYTLLPDRQMRDTLSEWQRLSKERIKVWIELQETSVRHSNPYIDNDESIGALLKTSVRKNKIQKDLKKKYSLLESKLIQLDEELNRLRLHMETLEQEEVFLHYELEKIYQQFKVHLPLSYIDGHEKMVLEFNQIVNDWEEDARKKIQDLEMLAIKTEQV